VFEVLSVMKTYSLLSLFCVIALAQCACAQGVTPIATKLTSADVYTAIAVTLTAKATVLPEVIAPSATPSPTQSPTPTEESPTATLQQVANAAYVADSSACDSSVFVSDVTISDGSVIAPGQMFVKTWLLRNAGTCTWSKSYILIFVSGDDLDGEDTLIGESVSPGEQVKVSVSLTAPDDYATYTGYWRLVNASGVAFGASFWVKILVSDEAATVTSTPTATSETSTPTSTAQATATPIPTTAPTATPAPTSTLVPTAIPTNTDTPATASEPSSTPTVATYP
jgi:hypothetical protein